MTMPPGWTTLHDAESAKPRSGIPGGHWEVRLASIDAVLGYRDGGSTIVVSGAYLHVTEGRDEILDRIERDAR